MFTLIPVLLDDGSWHGPLCVCVQLTKRSSRWLSCTVGHLHSKLSSVVNLDQTRFLLLIIVHLSWVRSGAAVHWFLKLNTSARHEGGQDENQTHDQTTLLSWRSVDHCCESPLDALLSQHASYSSFSFPDQRLHCLTTNDRTAANEQTIRASYRTAFG